MQISINDPGFQTLFFAISFLTALFLTFKKFSSTPKFDNSVTLELKGFAILTIIFSHIGYFLSANQQFLFPLSILAGVGVNLFLFLSGYGLTKSALKKPLSIFSFYQKRLFKLCIPFWAVITIFYLMDFLILKRVYPMENIIHSYLGFFPKADLFLNLDSPLWYFSIILFYYLIFPLFFIRRSPIFSCFLILFFSYLILQLNLPIDKDVLKLYKIHFVAFPLGVFWAGLGEYKSWFDPYWEKIERMPLKAVVLLISAGVFIYTAYYSKVGAGVRLEELVSLITMFASLVVFWLLPFRFGLFNLFGVYSYEIYLFHWPILSRYDFLYQNFPAFLATLLYLLIFLILGHLLQLLDQKGINLKKIFGHNTGNKL